MTANDSGIFADRAAGVKMDSCESFGTARKQRIFEMWLAGHTQQEIASETGIDAGDLSKMAKGFLEYGNLAKSQISAAEHATDFDPPIYNIWKQQTKSDFRVVAGGVDWR